jgi:hypothetical protein
VKGGFNKWFEKWKKLNSAFRILFKEANIVVW